MLILRYNKDGVPYHEDETYFVRSTDPVMSSGEIKQGAGGQAGLQQISTGFQPVVVEIAAVADDDAKVNSVGKSTGFVQYTMANGSLDLTKTISVISAGNGWTGTVMMEPNGFSIDWTKVGQGLAVTLKYVATR